MTVKRGTGRTALIEATADVLRAGEEVQVKDIAAVAGVSHTLIYRHFPIGGKEELIAEAYAYIFRGLAEQDIEDLFTILEASGVDRDVIRNFIVTLLNPRRGDVRWLRLEALAQSRTNPYVAERIEQARRALVQEFADRLRRLEPRLSPESASAFSSLAQALPLGVTAIGGAGLSKSLRETVAGMWAGMLVDALEAASKSR